MIKNMKLVLNAPASEPALIPLPTYTDCLALMEAHGMLPNIREHSYLVMEVADFLGQALVAAGLKLHLPLISTGALLHDLGKAPCLGTGQNHAHWGADLLASLGYPELAQVVGEHVRLPEENQKEPRPVGETQVVNYADKRVLHARVVSLEERFTDLKVRYGRTPEALARLAILEVRTLALEEKIFAPLSFGPEKLLRINGHWRKIFRSFAES